jgi:hypothetical protein
MSTDEINRLPLHRLTPDRQVLGSLQVASAMAEPHVVTTHLDRIAPSQDIDQDPVLPTTGHVAASGRSTFVPRYSPSPRVGRNQGISAASATVGVWAKLMHSYLNMFKAAAAFVQIDHEKK